MTEITASNAEIVHYLAVFRRTFRYIAGAGDGDDRVAQVLGGWLGDTLHNMPGYLRRTEPDVWLDWRVTDFPAEMRASAPVPIARECARIFASDDDLNELALTADLSNLDLAPPVRRHAYLMVLRDAFLAIRYMRNFGAHRTFWNDIDARWNDEADKWAQFNARLAAHLQDIPRHLVHWNDFDEKAFLGDAQSRQLEFSGEFTELLISLPKLD